MARRDAFAFGPTATPALASAPNMPWLLGGDRAKGRRTLGRPEARPRGSA